MNAMLAGQTARRTAGAAARFVLTVLQHCRWLEERREARERRNAAAAARRARRGGMGKPDLPAVPAA